MKKLLLLAVVILGFAATSFAQKDATGWVTGTTTSPVSANASMTFQALTPLIFGNVTSSPLYDGTLLLKANGQVVKTNVTGSGQFAATFAVTQLNSGTPIILINPKHFELGHGGVIKLDINQDDPDYVSSSADATPGNYTVRIGGLLTVPAKSYGSLDVPSFTVTLNNL